MAAVTCFFWMFFLFATLCVHVGMSCIYVHMYIYKIPPATLFQKPVHQYGKLGCSQPMLLTAHADLQLIGGVLSPIPGMMTPVYPSMTLVEPGMDISVSVFFSTNEWP